MANKKAKAAFIEPMLLLRTEKLPEDPDWLVQLKLDGYKALAVKNGGQMHLRSRNDNGFNVHYAHSTRAGPLGSLATQGILAMSTAPHMFASVHPRSELLSRRKEATR